MNIILSAMLFIYLLFYGTWIFYIAFMGIKTHKKLLIKKLGFLWYGLYPLFIFALFMDVLFNIVIGTIYYRELPQEFLFTTRCTRHLKSSGVQLRRAKFVCMNLLDLFDEGHC